jgi:hypothetical protein
MTPTRCFCPHGQILFYVSCGKYLNNKFKQSCGGNNGYKEKYARTVLYRHDGSLLPLSMAGMGQLVSFLNASRFLRATFTRTFLERHALHMYLRPSFVARSR